MKLSLFCRLTMPLPELEAYYRDFRAEQFRKNKPVKGIYMRAKIHGIFVACLKIVRIISCRKLTTLQDCRRLRTKGKPIIYAVTHVGRYDIETALEVIKEPCFLFMGDPGNSYRNLDGIALFLNGVIFSDTGYKEDRYIGKETCVKLLRQGGNLLIFPEGAWNITYNKAVMPLFTGVAEMAIRTGAEILPVAIERRGKHYYAIVGENMDMSAFTLDEKQQATDMLRDVLATLKWEILENFAVCRRADLPENAAEQFLNAIMSETENGYTVEVIERTRYHSRDEIARQEIKAHLDKLKNKINTKKGGTY